MVLLVNSLICATSCAALYKRVILDTSYQTAYKTLKKQKNKLNCKCVSKVQQPSFGVGEDNTSLHQGNVNQVNSSKIDEVFKKLTNLFPVWVSVAGIIAVCNPHAYDWYNVDLLPLTLGLTMIFMGTTLKVKDFVDVFKAPKEMLLGLFLQYSVMPFLGFLISRFPGVPLPYAAGIVLVACCPGGTASNIITFIAGADVALSVSMTAASTLAAVFLTPLLTSTILGTLVAVDAVGLFKSTAQVVVLPIILGVILNEKFPTLVDKTRSVSPLIAVFFVALVCGAVMAKSVQVATMSVLPAIIMAYSLHIGGFILGYGIPRALYLAPVKCKTISIEVGMQNSTLGAVLAGLHFADPLTALPCAISAGTHSIIGSILATIWRWQSEKQMRKEQTQLNH